MAAEAAARLVFLRGGALRMTRDKTASGRLRFWPRLLFLIPFAAMLWVSSYNRTQPELFGIPFFYWYQLLWILIGSAIVLLVYTIDKRINRGTETASDPSDTTGIPGDIL
jgi:hypothetical protein